jgi:hypothetical protein
LEPIHGLGDWFDIPQEPSEAQIMFARTALLAAAASLTLVATPVLAQTFNGFENNDSAVTSGYAPYESNGYGYYNNGWNSGVPVVGPVLGLLTAPFGGWGQPGPWTGPNATGCHVDRDFNGRYTASC